MWDVSSLLVSVSTAEASEPSPQRPLREDATAEAPPAAGGGAVSEPSNTSTIQGLASSALAHGLLATSVALCRVEAVVDSVVGLASWAMGAVAQARRAKGLAVAFMIDTYTRLFRSIIRKIQFIFNVFLICTTALFCIPIVSIGAILALMASAAVHYLMSGYTFHYADSLGEPVELRSTAPRRFRLPNPGSFTNIASLVSAAADTARTVSPESVDATVLPPSSEYSAGHAACKETEECMSSPRMRAHSVLCLVLEDQEFLADVLEGLPGVDRTALSISAALHRMEEYAAKTKYMCLNDA